MPRINHPLQNGIFIFTILNFNMAYREAKLCTFTSDAIIVPPYVIADTP